MKSFDQGEFFHEFGLIFIRQNVIQSKKD